MQYLNGKPSKSLIRKFGGAKKSYSPVGFVGAEIGVRADAATVGAGNLPARVEPLEFAAREFRRLAELLEMQTILLPENELLLLEQLERVLVDHRLQTVELVFCAVVLLCFARGDFQVGG